MLQAAGVVLAGGKSSRMGTDKAMLMLDGRTLLERSVDKLKQSFSEIIIVDNGKVKYNLPGVREISDIYHDCGPIGGIHASLSNAKHDRVFVAACDLPFWGKGLAELLVKSCRGYDAAVPCIGCYFEPLLAVYSKSCLEIIEANLKEKNYKVSELYKSLKVNFIKRDQLDKVCRAEDAFYNINTYDEFCKTKEQCFKDQFHSEPENSETLIG